MTKQIKKTQTHPRTTLTKKPTTKPTHTTKSTALKKSHLNPSAIFIYTYSSLGLFPHVKIELIKGSALASILFALHSIL